MRELQHTAGVHSSVSNSALQVKTGLAFIDERCCNRKVYLGDIVTILESLELSHTDSSGTWEVKDFLGNLIGYFEE